MSGLSTSEYKNRASNQQSGGSSPPTSADSRLLDAAETLVTLQSVSSRGQGIRTRGGNSNQGTSEKSRAVYLPPAHSSAAASPLPRSSRMPPQPPISATASAMGPPPPPGPPQSGVTYVVINQSTSNLMKPPTDPPPKRGRGRGRGRGSSSSSESSRGRGRGRGRGAVTSRTPPASPSVITTDTIEETTQDSDVEMTDTELGKEMLPKEDTTFMVGQLELKDSIFDDLLNKKKLELLMDPEVMSIFANHQKMVRGNQAK